jgi:hypothetical protein
MATLKLDIDADLLARAEEASHLRGADLRSELMARVKELGTKRPSKQSEAVRRLIEMADASPGYLEGGMPDREERNTR